MAEYTPEIFEGIHPDAIRTAMKHMHRIEVEPGQVLIKEGDTDPSLVIVLSGELRIRTGDTELGVARSGDIVGEMALFSKGVRTATVESVTHSVLLLMDAAAYTWLRTFGSPAASAVEAHALDLLTDRLRDVSQRIAKLADGTHVAHVTPSRGFFSAVASMFGGGGLSSPHAVDKVALLQGSPLFEGASNEELNAAAQHFDLVGVRTGHFLITEGELGDEMYIVGHGLIDVVIATGEDRVEHLADLEPGEAFGMCALVDEGHTRMASCVAKEPSTVLVLKKLQFIELISGGGPVSSVLRVALIRALIDQLAYANGQLAMLEYTEARNTGAFKSLMRASAGVEAHGHYLDT